ncbi:MULTISPECIES: N-acyl-D-amino-acid deacylase family protein [Pseudofrankia]|uniref:N-acyl-D-amino-acid deacylase family protein n=1 Tax=Pseudofrankia TaxID=2994363 RepID=UPI000234B3AC|nr:MULTISPECIES: amidohydrolase family protein [Pseudofrankia]OHV29852.1 amidohydrolase [Pseudofrankia sp. EUN1h]
MANLLVRGGLLVDGTGSPARAADVRVRGGRVAEVGPGLAPAGERVLDAGGAVVAPGFIDNHTHVDPSLWWDASCDPMPQHGVATVLMGNCSLSLAPVRAADRAGVTSLFCYIEDLPESAFDAAIPWTWESWPDYRAAAAGRGFGVNTIGFVGHTPLRLFVMGPQAWERAATDAERAEMARVLDESLAAGALGLSSSLGFDEDREKRPVPSRLADDAELAALLDVVAARGRALQFIPDQTGGRAMRADVERIAALCGPRGIPHTWIGVFHDADHPNAATRMLDHALALQQQGVRTLPQVSPRTLDIRVNWSGGMSWFALADGWHRMVQADAATKRALLVDPAWRAVAREEWDRVPRTMIPHRFPDRLRLVEVRRPELARWVGATLADLVAERGGHPSDVLADWVLDNDLDPGLVGVGVANADPDGVAATLVHPAALIGNSDAGAHLQMMCATGDSTLLLTRHVRDRADLTLEQAVHALTGRQAEAFGLRGRGTVRAGAAGDLVVFALDELAWQTDVFIDDLPAGGSRLRRPSGGYRYTAVAGEVTQQDGELTDARPGRFLGAG